MSLECCCGCCCCYGCPETESGIEKSQYLFTVVGFCQHRAVRTAFRFRLPVFWLCWWFCCWRFFLVFAFCLVLPTWCIKFNSVVVRLSRTDSIVSGILIPVFCWLMMMAEAKAERKSNERYTTDSNRNMLFQLSLMHYKWKSNFQYLQKMENDCHRATFSHKSEKRVRKMMVRTMVAHCSRLFYVHRWWWWWCVLLRIEKR